jgi:hypothetical protein
MRFSSLAYRKGRQGEVRPFVVWSAVADHLDSTRNTWDFLNRSGKTPHLLWNPSTGEVLEGIPLDRQATYLPSSGVQLAVIADPSKPFTDMPLEGSEIVSKTLEPLGVPEVWPYGPPSLTSLLTNLFETSLAPGHYSANQLNGDWPGIGSIDIRRLHDRAYAAGD